MPTQSYVTARPSRLVARLLVLAIALAWLAVGPAAAAEPAVMIDNFAGAVLGTRTVTGLPSPDQSTTEPGVFSQSGGVGRVKATGTGNRPGGVQLDYAFPSTDLRAGDANTRFLVEFATIDRQPEPPAPQGAVLVSITVDDANGGSSSHSSVLDNSRNLDLALNLDCGAGSTACFNGNADFSVATHLMIQVMYPASSDSTGALEAVIDTIRTSPTGGVGPPAPPTPAITGPAEDVVYGAVGTIVEFPVGFRSEGEPVLVSHAPESTDGLRASDVTVTGTAPGISSVAVSGGPADYLIKVGPLTAAGSVQVKIAAGLLDDAWKQPTRASNTASTRFAIGVPPEFTAASPPSGQTQQRYAYQFSGGGKPAASYSLAAGTLPPGLKLSSSGRLSGTPTEGGSYPFTVRASNALGVDAEATTVTVEQAPTFVGPATAAFVLGEDGTFTVTTAGFPVPDLEVTSGTLPAGLTFTDNGNGTATLSGMPSAVGSATLGLRATNPASSATRMMTVEVNVAPGFTSLDEASFSVGTAGSFEITTAGRPEAKISTDDPLPAGLTLTDNGDGTATLAGTTTAPPGRTPVVLTAEQQAGADTQILTVEINAAPAIISEESASFTVGTAGSFTVTTGGRPLAELSLGDALPPGLGFVDRADGTAVISGIPTAPGRTTTVTVIAANVAGQDTQELTVTVLEPPVITSVAPVTFSVGAGGSYAITAAGYPAPAITAETTPAGLKLTDQGDGTATLSGTPTGPAATTAMTITATSTVGEATSVLTVVVDASPVFTSDDLVVFDRGVAGSFAITTTGDPAPSITTDDPLPAGLTLADHGDGTATVAGTPTADGPFVVDLTASNGAGTARQGLAIRINSAPEFRTAETTEFTEEEPGSFAVEADGFPEPTLTLQGELPAGLTFEDHGDGTAVIAGTPEAGRAGRYPVTVTATNRGPVAEGVADRATGTAGQRLVITVRAAPSSASPRPIDPSTGRDVDSGYDGDDEEAGTDLAGLASTGGPALAAAGIGLLLALVGVGLVAVARRRSGRHG